MSFNESGAGSLVQDRADLAGWSKPLDNEVDVLVVEDNPYESDITVHALKEHHPANRIKTVRDGAEAIDFIFCRGDYANRDPRQLPKLVLLDLNLPRVDGLEVLRRIRADPLTRDVPVVILTQSQEDSKVSEGYKLGANSFLVKRIDFEEFLKGVLALGTYWAMNRAPSKKSSGPPGESEARPDAPTLGAQAESD